MPYPYIGYKKDKKKYYVIKRPNNQSNPKVLKKIAKRLKKLTNENEGLELNDLQKGIINDIKKSGTVKLGAKKIDVAHNIAIGKILETMVERMNNPKKKDPAAEKFFDDTLSTDDESGREKAKGFFKKLPNPKTKRKEKLDDANDLAKIINRASKNLIFGHSRTNRSIKDKRDPHVVKNDGEHVETKTSAKLSKSFDKFRGKAYKPKSRKTDDGIIEYQSSSICNVPGLSFFAPKKTPSASNKEKQLGQKMLAKGYKLFSLVCKKEEQGKDPLDLPEYEELCELIDNLSYFKNKKFFNELAMAVSNLQLRIEAADYKEKYAKCDL